MLQHPIFFAGRPGGQFGWGVCNQHLLDELSRRTQVVLIEENTPDWSSTSLPGHLFTPLSDHQLQPVTPARGRFNYGYTFFEHELTDLSVINARQFDGIFAGCTWCQERLAEKGILHATVLIQGVDSQLFHPSQEGSADGRFVIFSGGKFEFRKGQDLVLRAMQILQKKYPDMVLVNAWNNQWAYSLATMKYSPYIKCDFGEGSWSDQMNRLYRLNDLDPRRIMTLPLLPQEKMVRAYQLSDLGLFPNRCEGGTNLVMMEYLACGKPVVATYATGHRDVLTDENAFLLRSLRPVVWRDSQGTVLARWQEPFLDDLVAQVEHAYHHRESAKLKGTQAAADMRQFTWARAAEVVLRHMREQEEHPNGAGVSRT